MTLLILCLACSKYGKITDSSYVLNSRPASKPEIFLGSPIISHSAGKTIYSFSDGTRVEVTAEGEKFFILPEKAFLKDKKNHLEKNEYIDYLLEFFKNRD